MINVNKDEVSDNVSIHFDDETLQGQFSIIKLDDHAGLELVSKLCGFYEAKGYNVARLLMGLPRAQTSRPWWKRFFGVK